MAIDTKDVVNVLKKHPVAIGCGVLSLILIAGIYLRNGRASDLADQLHQKETDGQKVLDDIRNGANLPEQYQALAATTKDLESRLVVGSERARNQQYFYRIESETGVTEINLQPIAASGSPRGKLKQLYTGVGFAITVQGDFAQIVSFLTRLESGRHFYRLVSASVSRKGNRAGDSASGLITLSLNLEFLGKP
jgi:hypothetical protein